MIRLFKHLMHSLGEILRDLTTSEISKADGKSSSPFGILSLVALKIKASSSAGVVTDILVQLAFELGSFCYKSPLMSALFKRG